jgi:hypothetical protein
VDGDFWVEIGGSYNAKTYGNTLKTPWSIHVSDIIDPGTMLPRPVPLYPLAYAYEAGPFWGADVKVDTQVIEIVGDWDPANDLVTRPFLEDAFYGLKAKYDNIGKAIDYMQNTKNKYIAMVPLLGKFIK